MIQLVTSNQFIASFLLITIAITVRWLVVQQIQKMPYGDNDLHRRWVNGIKNTVTTLVVIGLIVIWLSELRFLALSIATFTVALIIATREFIQCFLGALYQTSTRVFTIGDWIKVNHQYGEVVSSDWLTTKLLEIDMDSMSYGYTGKTLIIPNNQFISNITQNLNFMRRYIAHSFTIVRDSELIDVCAMKDPILKKAQEYSEPHNAVAQRYNAMLEQRLGVKLPGPESSIRVTTSNLGKNEFTITVFCPTEAAVNIEQKLTEDFMKLWYEASSKVEKNKNVNKLT